MKNILVQISRFYWFSLFKNFKKKFKVVGIDNINNYYDKKIKYDRLRS